jgi:hypothetical protein
VNLAIRAAQHTLHAWYAVPDERHRMQRIIGCLHFSAARCWTRMRRSIVTTAEGGGNRVGCDGDRCARNLTRCDWK